VVIWRASLGEWPTRGWQRLGVTRRPDRRSGPITVATSRGDPSSETALASGVAAVGSGPPSPGNDAPPARLAPAVPHRWLKRRGEVRHLKADAPPATRAAWPRAGARTRDRADPKTGFGHRQWAPGGTSATGRSGSPRQGGAAAPQRGGHRRSPTRFLLSHFFTLSPVPPAGGEVLSNYARSDAILRRRGGVLGAGLSRSDLGRKAVRWHGSASSRST
jgi:hypothetical protein